MLRIFIDGQAGTTGLKIQQRLSKRDDVLLLTIDPARRKDPAARKALLNQADAAILCLPDDAAREAVALVENPNVCILDTSTAHRVQTGWTFGFPELSTAHREAVAGAKRIAVPGCHATGFIAAVYPLVQMELLPENAALSCHSVTGYSGGGNKMIAEYAAPDRPAAYDSPRQYGLSLTHKHLPEMMRHTGLMQAPVFNPIVSGFFAGMAVSVPLHLSQLSKRLRREDLQALLAEHYAGQRFVKVKMPPADGFLPANGLAGTNDLHLYVCGNDDMVTLISVFDNLGKGASGAAMQCMNIAMGLDEGAGFGKENE